MYVHVHLGRTLKYMYREQRLWLPFLSSNCNNLPLNTHHDENCMYIYVRDRKLIMISFTAETFHKFCIDFGVVSEVINNL